MATTVVDFGGPGVARSNAAISPTVYTKTNWNDDWAIQLDLWPEVVTWAVAPTMPTATLRWDYGWLRTPTNLAYFQRLRRTGNLRLYVKIVCPTDDYDFDDETELLNREWYGVLEIEGDQLGGVLQRVTQQGVEPIPTGKQSFTAYGLEKLLADWPIDRAAFTWFNPASLSTEVAFQYGNLPAFNADGKPNRSTDQTSAGFGRQSYTFESDPLISQYWSSRNIVEYLMHRVGPVDKDGFIGLPFNSVLADSRIPDWDRPTLDQNGQTIYSLLGRLLDRRRLWLYWFTVEPSPSVGVFLNAETLAVNDITLPVKGSAPFPANLNKVALRFDLDQGTQATVKRSQIETVDQIVARGARRVSVFSISKADATLENGWDTGLLTEYNDGASNSADWATMGTTERQKRNREIRESDKLDDVFSLYSIPSAWDFLSGDGLGTFTTLATKYSVFPHDTITRDDDERPQTVPAHLGSTFIEQDLPLLVGVDYSGGKIQAGTVDETVAATDPQNMQPFIVFRVPETASLPAAQQRWARADKVGENAGLEVSAADEGARWSASLFVPDKSRSLKIRVTGAPRHIIDGETVFIPLEHESLRVDPELAAWNINNGAIATVAMLDPRFAEGRYPADADVSTTRDVVRRKYIDAGEQYRQVYVVPETVVGVDADGVLLRSDGGYLPYDGATGGEDDVTKLEAIARLAAEWYTAPRYVLTLSSVQLRAVDNAADDFNDWENIIALGCFVESIGQAFPGFPGNDNFETVNTPITQVSFEYPTDGQSPRMLVQTWSGELDALQYAPAAVGVSTPHGRRLGPAVSDTF